MERELRNAELEELYQELEELKIELQDYYSENSGFSNGADFSLGFASRSKHIMERITELEEEEEVKMKNESFEILLKNLNHQIRLLNAYEFHIYDEDNPGYWIDEIFYNDIEDKIYFRMEDK